MRQTKLQLSEEDRAVIHDIRMKGLHQAREVNRAHVLASLDQGVPEAQIMAVRGIGRTAVWRMYALLELYARPLRTAEPVIYRDEKSLQLIAHSRPPLPGTMPFRVEHSPTKQDCEYVRNGTTNLFVAVEPKAGRRIVEVTAQRGKIEFVTFVGDLLTIAYAKGLCQGTPSSPGSGQPEHPLPQVARRCHGKACGCRAAAPSPIPLHAQACALAEHGGDRDRRPEPAMPGLTDRQSRTAAGRSRRLATGTKRRPANHRMEVHRSRCRSKTWSSVCFGTCVLMY